MKFSVLACLSLALAGCAGAQATRTSANTMVVQASAAPACGPQGAARVAALTVAVETIRAGYDRYIIGGARAQDNVQVTQLPGHAQTSGTVTSYGGGLATYRGTTTYVPGPTVISGSHDQDLQVMMFRAGDPGYDNALDAKQMLGPEWQERVRNGIRTCL